MTDPLASWKTGPVKSAILDFVDRVTLRAATRRVGVEDHQRDAERLRWRGG